MNLPIAIARGALDVAHGLLSRGQLLLNRLFDKILDTLSIALGQSELVELRDLTYSSGNAARAIFDGHIDPRIVPVADGPYFGSVTGAQYDKFQMKVVSRLLGPDGEQIDKKIVYMEFPTIPDKIGVEEYIRQFWEDMRAAGHDTLGLTYAQIPGTVLNVPIYAIQRAEG